MEMIKDERAISFKGDFATLEVNFKPFTWINSVCLEKFLSFHGIRGR
jgi:hypothetical protein